MNLYSNNRSLAVAALVAAPAAGILIAVLCLVQLTAPTLEMMQSVERVRTATIFMSSLLEEVQFERGWAANYVLNGSEEHYTEYQNIIGQTDEAAAVLEEQMRAVAGGSRMHEEFHARLNRHMAELEDIRAAAFLREPDSDGVLRAGSHVNAYTNLMADMLDTLSIVANNIGRDESNLVDALVSLFHLRANAAIEMGVGASEFRNPHIVGGGQHSWFLQVLAKGSLQEVRFLRLAPQEWAEAYRDRVAIENYPILEKLRQSIIDKGYGESFDASRADDWHESSRARLREMTIFKNEYLQAVSDQMNATAQQARSRVMAGHIPLVGGALLAGILAFIGLRILLGDLKRFERMAEARDERTRSNADDRDDMVDPADEDDPESWLTNISSPFDRLTATVE